jgi:hypothetical protein
MYKIRHTNKMLPSRIKGKKDGESSLRTKNTSYLFYPFAAINILKFPAKIRRRADKAIQGAAPYNW